jgi:site-specific DNA-cytosine methylase
VDFSGLNNHQMDLEDEGESGQTFNGILGYVKLRRPPLVILENVRNAPWDKIADRWEAIGYAFRHKIVDTKHFYLPQTRERGYAICVDSKILDDDPPGFSLESWDAIFQSLGRHASAPFTKFILPDDDPRLEHIKKEVATRGIFSRAAIVWDKYRMRHQRYRRDQELGDGRPLTRYADNGKCQMPAFAWHEWANLQPERVWDTLDMNYLRSLRSYDLNYKE